MSYQFSPDAEQRIREQMALGNYTNGDRRVKVGSRKDRVKHRDYGASGFQDDFSLAMIGLGE